MRQCFSLQSVPYMGSDDFLAPSPLAVPAPRARRNRRLEVAVQSRQIIDPEIGKENCDEPQK